MRAEGMMWAIGVCKHTDLGRCRPFGRLSLSPPDLPTYMSRTVAAAAWGRNFFPVGSSQWIDGNDVSF